MAVRMPVVWDTNPSFQMSDPSNALYRPSNVGIRLSPDIFIRSTAVVIMTWSLGYSEFRLSCNGPYNWLARIELAPQSARVALEAGPS
jgi:hypothetical protein